mmetsp:Transcript_12369/g.25998  ORF Transcript_12369/g.25998 Transcript_12369/m.25998 type:complete len:272 (+) Transcript_12369:291-1106(+)
MELSAEADWQISHPSRSCRQAAPSPGADTGGDGFRGHRGGAADAPSGGREHGGGRHMGAAVPVRRGVQRVQEPGEHAAVPQGARGDLLRGHLRAHVHAHRQRGHLVRERHGDHPRHHQEARDSHWDGGPHRAVRPGGARMDVQIGAAARLLAGGRADLQGHLEEPHADGRGDGWRAGAGAHRDGEEGGGVLLGPGGGVPRQPHPHQARRGGARVGGAGGAGGAGGDPGGGPGPRAGGVHGGAGGGQPGPPRRPRGRGHRQAPLRRRRRAPL